MLPSTSLDLMQHGAHEMVELDHLMAASRGSCSTLIGVVDGPVDTQNPNLRAKCIKSNDALRDRGTPEGAATAHGTAVALALVGDADAGHSRGICPDCVLSCIDIFGRHPEAGADAETLAEGIAMCLARGSALVNLSIQMRTSLPGKSPSPLTYVLDEAARRDVLIVAAAGNGSALHSSLLTSHPWVIPVAPFLSSRLPMQMANLGRAVGSRGLGAPGFQTAQGATSPTMLGSSVAAPYVSGALALLISIFPQLPRFRIKDALLRASGPQRNSIVPPLMKAHAAFRLLHALSNV